MQPLRRCLDLIRGFRTRPEREWAAPAALYLSRVREEVEAGLRHIDFEEVTTEDRITFLECVIAWQVRVALGRGRFDLAVQVQRFGVERIAELYERAHGWRPVLLYGVPLSRERHSHQAG